MTVAEAAREWEEAKRQVDQFTPKMKQAGEVLKAHFRRTGRSTYKDRIAYKQESRRRLDDSKVKAELGSRLPNFQRTVPYETLTLLKP